MEEHPEPIQPESEESTPTQPGSKPLRTSTLIIIGLASLVIICGYCWYKAEEEISRMEISKNHTFEFSPDGTTLIRHWRSTNELASSYSDVNFDGNYEHGKAFTMEGHTLHEWYDDNEDGFEERSVAYSPYGGKIAEYYDMDEDGCSEREIQFDDDLKVEYKDTDLDCEFDSIYVYYKDRLVNTLSDEQFDRFLLPSVADSASAQK